MREIYHKENPFISELKQKIRPVVRSRKQKGPILTTDGEFMQDDKGVIMAVTHTGAYPGFEDDEQYIKLYLEHIDLLRKISAPGVKVFSHIMEILKPKNDVVFLNSSQMATKLEISRVHVYNGIKSLCQEKLIARAYTGKRRSVAYWINPNIFYNGNRQHLLNKR